jgi:predicted PurR-regulated permease PerM
VLSTGYGRPDTGSHGGAAILSLGSQQRREGAGEQQLSLVPGAAGRRRSSGAAPVLGAIAPRKLDGRGVSPPARQNGSGGLNRAAGVFTVVLVAAAMLPLLMIGVSLASSAVSLGQQLQKASGVSEALQSVFGASPQGVQSGLDLQRLGQFLQQHRAEAWQVVTRVFGAATAAGIGAFVFFYGFYTFLVDGGRAREWLLDHSPLERWQTERLAAAYEESGKGLLIGVGLTALLQGGAATIGYLIIGVPQALVFGLLTTIAALIPSFGTALVWVPVAAGMFIAGKTGSAIAVIGVGCVVALADNIARPMITRYAHLDLPTYVLLVAMLGGIVAFGPWGLFAGPLFVRLAREALRIGREQRELGRARELIEH